MFLDLSLLEELILEGAECPEVPVKSAGFEVSHSLVDGDSYRG